MSGFIVYQDPSNGGDKISGTGNPFPIQQIGSIPTGANKIGSADVQPSLPLEVSGSASALNTDIITSTDVSQCTDITVQLTGTWSGVVTFQCSNDNINWTSCNSQFTSAANNSPSSTATFNAIYFIVTPFKYFRARITSYTSGTFVGTLVGNRLPTSNMTIGGQIVVAASSNVIGSVKHAISSAGGASVLKKNSDSVNSAINIKNTASTLLGLVTTNTSAAIKYIKFYNKATAPTVGTDTPLITIGVPAGQTISHVFAGDFGVAFSLGISIGFTGAVADADTTVLAANDLVANVTFV